MGEVKDMMINKCRKGCPYYGRHDCSLTAGHSMFDEKFIKGCPLETEEIMKRQLVPGGQLEFLAKADPIAYLRSISYMRRDTPPKVGDIVITLRGGFSSSSSGKILEIESVEGNQITLKSPYTEDDHQWIVCIIETSPWPDNQGWWDSLYVYIESESSSIESQDTEENVCGIIQDIEEEEYYDE